jgi:cysteine desulfurase family protein (TIGR01976 family)
MTNSPMSLLDPLHLRKQFPSLSRLKDGRPVIFADGPGGTQVPRSVTAAMTTYLETSNANFGGTFITSKETGDLVAQVRAGVKNFLNATVPEEIIFGQNMTSLTFSMSRAIARTWQAGDEVIVTALDHDANVAPWMLAAEDRGAIVRTLPFHSHDATLSLEKFTALLSSRTRMVALGYASNAVGTIIDLAPFISAAHRVGALVYVDAVHFAPHGIIDVRAIDCDFLACSAYKFCGPHIGILYGKKTLLDSLTAYKVRPSSAVPPGKWETGTQNTEAIAGLRACLGYLGELGVESSTDPLSRLALTTGMKRIVTHESSLSQRFLAGLKDVPGARLYGIADPTRIPERTPTFGFTLDGCFPHTAAERLAERSIFVWDGHFYAKGVVDQLGLAQHGGLIRIGFAHYNTIDEVDHVLSAVKKLSL